MKKPTKQHDNKKKFLQFCADKYDKAEQKFLNTGEYQNLTIFTEFEPKKYPENSNATSAICNWKPGVK